MPTEARGATYLSFKILYELFTPQIYLIVFWYVPKSLFVHDVLQKQTLMEIDQSEPMADEGAGAADAMLLEDKESQPEEVSVNTSVQ